MSRLLFAPYLPVSSCVRIGPWQLIPFKQLADCDALPRALEGPVLRLIEAYRLPSGGGSVLGAVAFPTTARIGAEIDQRSIEPLRRALLAGTVADNPLMTSSEDEQSPNAGHAIATSENAVLLGHLIGDGRSYATETGVLLRVANLRHAADDQPLPAVAPPVELPRPIFGGFDEEVADAAHAVLVGDGSGARRLHRALDWYRIALSNAEAVTPDVRVGAARSAFEVLTGAGDATKKVVRDVGRLFRDSDTTETLRESIFWKGPVNLTPDEWWFARLSELRNAIVHGDEVPADLWVHEGHHHIDHIHDALVRALRITAADQACDPLLRLSRRDRIFPRISQQIAATATPGSEGA